MKRTSTLVVGLVLAALGLAGCGTAAQAGSTGYLPASPPSGASRDGSGRQGRFPGVSGLVAQVAGSTVQVQSRTSQTAVTWTSSTRITVLRPTTHTALHVGTCVIARPARPGGATATGSGAGTPSAGAAGDLTAVDAATVEILPSTAGRCALGAAPDRGTRPSGIPTQQGNGRARRAFGAVGTVTAVGPTSFTVSRATNAPTAASGASTPSTVTVTWSGTTTFSTLVPATSAAVKVGVCVTATGKPDDTGAVTATSIAVSPAVNGACPTAFGFRGFGGGGQQGGFGSTPGAANG